MNEGNLGKKPKPLFWYWTQAPRDLTHIGLQPTWVKLRCRVMSVT